MFVGHTVERELLRQSVRLVASGQGGAAWVSGDAGIGKSALIAAGLAEAQSEGCRVYSAVAYERTPAFPLQMLIDAFSVDNRPDRAPGSTADPLVGSREVHVDLLYPDHTAPATPSDMVATATARMAALVHRFCAAAPTILVVDDAQWADAASLDVLQMLSRDLGQVPLFLVAAVRPVLRRPDLDGLRDALITNGARHLELGPVGPAEVAELVRLLLGVPPGPVLAEQLAAAGGNPLYLLELIDALSRESRLELAANRVELRGPAADLPTTLPAAIARRLRFLSAPALSAMRMAAVLGRSFAAGDLQIASSQPAAELTDAINEAIEAGVLGESSATSSGPTLAFRHELIHHTLYEGMAASLRSALHRQAAKHLAEAGTTVDRVAAHLLAAPEAVDPWVTDWIADAAPALTHRAPQVAAELLGRARERLYWPDPRRDRVAAQLAMTHLVLGDNNAIVALVRPALEYTHDPATVGQLAWTLAEAVSRLGRLDEAVDVIDQTLAREGLPAVWSARLRARRAMALFAVGRYDEARNDAECGETEATEAGDRLALGYSLYSLAQLEFIHPSRTASATAIIERALAVLAEEPEATDLLLMLTANLGAAMTVLGPHEQADAIFGQVAVLVPRGTPPCQAQVRVMSGAHAFFRGRWDEALAEVDIAGQLPLDANYRQCMGGVGAQVAVHRDDPDAAERYLYGAEVVPMIDGEARLLVELLKVAWALAAERDGNPAQALTRLRSTFDPDGSLEFARVGAASNVWLPDVVRLALTVGEPDVAAAAARVCMGEPSTPTVNASARHCQGLIAGDPTVVREAAEMLSSVGCPLFRAQALENAAVLYAERGDIDSSRAALLEAIDGYTDLDAAWDIIRADARLREHHVRRGVRGSRRRAAVGWESLTPTERKVAHLVAAGLSNPNIATQLFVSRHTVEHHVSRILAKLDARSRVDITHAAVHSARSMKQ